MFFPEKVKNIHPLDRVLEVGPGGNPHPRADVLLDKKFHTEEETLHQRGDAPKRNHKKQLVLFDGEHFPFKNKCFDYVICSHVLEHVQNIEAFLAELQRIASRGYLEFPTIYYDYIYNFPEHLTFLFHRDGRIHYMPKGESGLSHFLPVNRFFYQTLKHGYDSMILALKEYMFQGFEWDRGIEAVRATSLNAITYDIEQIVISQCPTTSETTSQAARILARLKKIIWSRVYGRR